MTPNTRLALFALATIVPPVMACAGSEPTPAPPPPPVASDMPTVPPVSSTSPTDTGSTTAQGANDVPWKVIYDFDNPPAPKAAGPDDDKIVTKIVADHKKSQKDCKGKGTVATLDSAAQGAFTGKGTTENAYLVRLSPCGAKDDSGDKFKLAVISGDKVSRNIDVGEAWIAGVTDIDSDGDNEVVLVGGSSAAGVTSVTARLVELTAPQVQVLFDWHEISHSVCKGAADDHAESAIIQYRARGTEMEFHADKKSRSCK